jgi:hypothetical protein
VEATIVADIHKNVKLLTKHPPIATKESVLVGRSKIHRSLVVRHIFKVIEIIERQQL